MHLQKAGYPEYCPKNVEIQEEFSRIYPLSSAGRTTFLDESEGDLKGLIMSHRTYTAMHAFGCMGGLSRSVLGNSVSRNICVYVSCSSLRLGHVYCQPHLANVGCQKFPAVCGSDARYMASWHARITSAICIQQQLVVQMLVQMLWKATTAKTCHLV